MIDYILDGELDLPYLHGDQTIKGISIDPVLVYPLASEVGWIMGDDFSSAIFQYDLSFDPTLVYPFAVWLAEPTGARSSALSQGKFLIR